MLIKFMWVEMILQKNVDQGVKIALEWMIKNSSISEIQPIFKTKIKLEDMEQCFYKIQIWTYNMVFLLKINRIKI
jgi:hypothetical protein